ncbi:MAG: NAD(P)H-dependent oxidoreductase [Schleiferiaceae bacterium]|jgi:multimeric flavodoxin WrbA|nr:NAD(P)H-dependent oxidoreductase [Schleiferiaceae bacterium]
MKTMIIQGSARSEGNTKAVVTLLQQKLNADVIDLKKLDYSGFDYAHANREDDFLPTMKKLVQYDLFLFVTPVYWYSMSGLMKNFFDRITDCLKIDKETGRKLRGLKMAAVACGSDDLEAEGFFIPFQKSADYLGMTYKGSLHTWAHHGNIEPPEQVRIKEFVKTLTE